MDELLSAIQAVLDAAGDGWTVNQFVVSMGIERITSDGELESTTWWTAPRDQPEWQTTALLNQTLDDRANQDCDP